MLRTSLPQCLRPIASSSSSHHLFHTSAFLHAETARIARQVKKFNNKRKEERYLKARANRPSVILGVRPGDERKWEDCDLARILVNEGELNDPNSSDLLKPVSQPIGTVNLPKHLSFGVGEEEKQILFKTLPVLSAQAFRKSPMNPMTVTTESYQASADRELHKANNFAKVLDLRNASQGGIAYENRKRIIMEFSAPENPFDPGRSEVQAALLTYRIRNLWSHREQFKRDVRSRLSLRKLVHQRAKALKYLKGVSRERYDTILERLALEPESVEGELVV